MQKRSVSRRLQTNGSRISLLDVTKYQLFYDALIFKKKRKRSQLLEVKFKLHNDGDTCLIFWINCFSP